MIYLIAAILCSTLIFINFKLYSKFDIDKTQAIVCNYFVAFFAGFLRCEISSPRHLVQTDWFSLSCISGTMLILIFFVFATSTEKVGIAITSISSKISVIIPVLLGFFVFDEIPSTLKILGITMVVPAFILIFSNNKQAKLNKSFILLPIMLFLGNGCNDSLMKTAEFYFLNSDNEQICYLTSAFGISFLIGILILSIQLFKRKLKIKLKNYIAGTILGLLNWFSTLFFLKGLSIVDVSVFVPIFSLSIVGLASLIGILFFKEKMNKQNTVGLFLAIFAILLIVLDYD